MQRDAVYLADLREFPRTTSFEDFRSSKTLRYAMLHALTIVGEANSKL